MAREATIPLAAFLLSVLLGGMAFFGVLGIFAGLAISNLAGGFYARFAMRKELIRVGSSLVARSPMQDMLNDLRIFLGRNPKAQEGK